MATTMTVGVGVGLGATMTSEKTNVEIAKADGSWTECTRIDVYDDAGWNFTTVWLDNFSFYSGYSFDDMEDFVEDSYVTSLDEWNKEGTTRSYHFYGSGVNLCAGDASGQGTTNTFYLPWWVTNCNIAVENNSNSYNFGTLTSMYKWTNNTSETWETGYKKIVYLSAHNWGGSSTIGDAAWVDFGSCTITKYAYNTTPSQIQSLGTDTINKYNRYSTSEPVAISEYEFSGNWYENSALTQSYSTKLIVSNTNLYAKYNSVSVAFQDGQAMSYNSTNSQFEAIRYFEDNETFHIVKTVETTPTNYAALDSYMSSSVATSDGTNVTVKSEGTYAVYFKSDNTIWLELATAEQEAYMYAGFFLGNVGCDSSGVSLPSGWSTVAARYDSLSDDAKDIFYSASANESGTTIEQTAARYDYAVAHHSSLTRFMKNSSGTARAVAARAINPVIFNNTTSVTTIIVALATISLLGVTGYFFLRKKREN